MDSEDVETSDMVEAEEEGDLTIEDLVGAYPQENGKEAKHHQSASPVSVEAEEEAMAVTGAVEEEGDGNCMLCIRHHDMRACLSSSYHQNPFMWLLVRLGQLQ